MNFTIKPIKKEEKKPKVVGNPWSNGFFGKITGVFGRGYGLLLFLLLVTAGGLALATSIAEKATGRTFERPKILQNKPQFTNILLLGVAGASEEGGYLTDSIMLASVYPKRGEVRLLSIPRDTWVEDNFIGHRKINSIYAVARSKYGKDRALDVTKTAIANLTKQEIEHAVVTDFTLFEDFVDELGGIEIFVSKPINDPFYPAPNYQYQRFSVRAGTQIMNGATALKYARSRQTTSDFDRSRRQHDILMAIKDRALDLRLLTDFGKLKDFYSLYQKKIHTDLGISDIISLAKVGVGIDKSNLLHMVLSDDPTLAGGILTPGAKSIYGQFVLVPKIKEQVDTFFELFFASETPLADGARIEILNGTKTAGLANVAKQFLVPLGFDVTNVSNTDKDVVLSEDNFIQLLTNADVLNTFDFLKDEYSAKELKKDRKGGEVITADIRLIIGKDKFWVDDEDDETDDESDEKNVN